MKVVCNASPLLFLSKIDALDLLPGCFAEIYAPLGVIAELQGLPLPAFVNPQTLSPHGMGFVQGALGNLHRGELEAMRLALEIHADFVLLDDLAARRKAKHLGLRVMGTVGVLLLSHQSGLLSADTARDYLGCLMEKHHLYLSPAVQAEIETALQESS